MKVIGYSERGALNSLLYEISYSESAERLVGELLTLVHFPFLSCGVVGITEATILVEQSLSDFGDADAVMLLCSSDGPMAVFIEAKVKPSQKAAWHIEEEYQQFVDGTATTVSSSNLFTQLYHKVSFVSGLRRGGITELERGLRFPPSSTLRQRKIGYNAVVHRATEQIRMFLKQVRYVALVPDEPDRVAEFFATRLAMSAPPGYDEWSTRDYGFICWCEIESFCRTQGLLNTIQVLEFNTGQIY
ncbi:MAG: hypothetical protein QHH30_01490 [candidate division NC10 bacterium]|nr:hypothetical protein [candidate division NC10 bacterium]